MTTHFNHTDPNDPPQDSQANIAHDRKYGWHVKFPREYTNIARNLEYQAAAPHQMLAGCRTEEEVRKAIWDWHNRNKLEVLERVEEKEQQSDRLLFA